MATTNGHTRHNSTSTTSTQTEPLPIVIAGGGCVGLFLALLLCQSKIPNRVIVIEPHPPSPADTKAMAHQPLIFPLFNSANLLPELSSLGSYSSGLCFRTSVKNGSRLIAGKQFKEGEKSQLLLPQWKFRELLMRKVSGGDGEGNGKGEVKMGWRIKGFEDKEGAGNGWVDVRVEDEKGVEEVIEAVYLIGADGAKSTVRKLLGVNFEGETLDAQLVATDIVFDFKKYGFYDANFIIDPADYGLIGRIDDEGLWRVSYGVEAGLSEDEIQAGVDEKLRKMLPNEGKDGYVVKRVAPYKAQQRAAETFWKGRVGLCGDAAHLTNPYAGLGLASGIADASSLAEVLIRLLSPPPSNHPSSQITTNSPVLLSSWAEARKQKFLTVVDKPSRMAYKRVKTKVDTDEDVERLLGADPLVGALKKGMPMVPPSLVTRGSDLEGW